MGGSIRVESEKGVGSIFFVSVTLPIASLAEELTADEAAEADFTGMRALLAEDNEINALLARRVCERAGCSVTVVKDGAAAVAAVEQAATQSGQAFDLILMDVFMPQLDGLEATRAIKALLPECPPIVALTANAFADDRDRCLAAGMDDYLAKPFDVAQLQAVLQHWLPRHDTRHAS